MHVMHPRIETLLITAATPAAAPNSCEKLPRAPISSSDPRLSAGAGGDGRGGATTPPSPSEGDLSKLPAAEALKLLSAGLELLVRLTGDVPPTPPPKTPTDPQMSGLRVEKEKMARSLSEKSSAKLLRRPLPAAAAQQQQPSPDETEVGQCDGLSKLQAYSASMAARVRAQQHQLQLMQHQHSHHDQAREDKHDGELTGAGPPGCSDVAGGVRVRHRPPPSPPSSAAEQPGPYTVVGADAEPLNLQHGAITRKFYSKKEPPISIAQYLQRLHQFCPMSTAVYLATSLYIHRLAIEERAMAVTRRNAHRLVLAGLRVAMKALEDRSYPHAKVARVGGVSESELTRLEISFCFLAGFDLVVGEGALRRHWDALRGGRVQPMLRGLDASALRLGRRRG